jgi:hypothetical protein
MSAVFSIGIFSGPAGAEGYHNDSRYGRDRHDPHGGWGAQYYGAPPIVYGSPYYGSPYYAPGFYRPPVVYGPPIGIYAPGVRIGGR